jgi:hypothetical protein
VREPSSCPIGHDYWFLVGMTKHILLSIAFHLVLMSGYYLAQAEPVTRDPAPIQSTKISEDEQIEKITEKILLDQSIVKKIKESQKICTKTVVRKGKSQALATECTSWKRRLAVVIRWIQNSKLYPFEPLQRIDVDSPYFELAKLAESEDPIDYTKHEVFAAPATINFIKNIAERASRANSVPMKVTAVTTSPEKATDIHQTHITGYAFDVRPFPGGAPTSWKTKDKKLYDRTMNKEFILRLAEEAGVKKVIFNDPLLLSDKQVKKALKQRTSSGLEPLYFISDNDICIQKNWRNCKLGVHDNHIHIELHMPKALESLALKLLEGTNMRPVRTTGL